MDYIGSKERLNKWIFNIIEKNISNGWFLDACSGSGSVSYFASKMGWKILSNDNMSFSAPIIYGSCNFNWKLLSEAISHINNMNTIIPIEGFFYNNYSDASNFYNKKNNGNDKRLFFTKQNAGKIDAQREYIENTENISIKNYLLYCLIEAVSKVSNTTGIQAAYLKKFKERALKDIYIVPEEFIYNKDVFCFKSNIENFWNNKTKYKEDVIYLDPPYNHRQYGPNYHLFETLIKNDAPEIKGVAGIRNWEENKSGFCNKDGFKEIITKILEKTHAKYLFLSYNTDGLLKEDEIYNIFKLNKRVENIIINKINFKRYKADNNRENNSEKLFEILFEVKLSDERTDEKTNVKKKTTSKVYDKRTKNKRNRKNKR